MSPSYTLSQYYLQECLRPLACNAKRSEREVSHTPHMHSILSIFYLLRKIAQLVKFINFIREVRLRISVGTPTILTGVFTGFVQSLQTNIGIVS